MRRRGTSEKTTSKETENGSLLEAIDTGIEAMRQHLADKGFEKGSLSDLVRLLQLRKELGTEKPLQICARWVGDEACERWNG